MASHPAVRARAQAELTAVVGPDRLPTVQDQPNLPYITAILKECFRWRSVVPLSIPHQSTEEDEYRGYRIPKGSIIVANTWCVAGRVCALCPLAKPSLNHRGDRAYSRDPSYYSDPEAFKPERFLTGDGQLDPEVRDPAAFVFGYGRR